MSQALKAWTNSLSMTSTVAIFNKLLLHASIAGGRAERGGKNSKEGQNRTICVSRNGIKVAFTHLVEFL